MTFRSGWQENIELAATAAQAWFHRSLRSMMGLPYIAYIEVAQIPCPTFLSDEACGAVLDTKLCPPQHLTRWLKRRLAAF